MIEKWLYGFIVVDENVESKEFVPEDAKLKKANKSEDALAFFIAEINLFFHLL